MGILLGRKRGDGFHPKLRFAELLTVFRQQAQGLWQATGFQGKAV